MGMKRIYVHSSIYTRFLSAVVDYTKCLRVGDGFNSNTHLGPVQNEMQYNRVKEFLDDIEKKDLKVALGGFSNNSFNAGKGYFINPTIVDNPRDDSRIVVEEPFGQFHDPSHEYFTHI